MHAVRVTITPCSISPTRTIALPDNQKQFREEWNYAASHCARARASERGSKQSTYRLVRFNRSNFELLGRDRKLIDTGGRGSSSRINATGGSAKRGETWTTAETLLRFIPPQNEPIKSNSGKAGLEHNVSLIRWTCFHLRSLTRSLSASDSYDEDYSCISHTEDNFKGNLTFTCDFICNRNRQRNI